MEEKLWQEFFADPSKWWDNRAEKVNVRYPDFKHKETQESLWLNSRLKPSWVEAKLAALTPGTVKVDIFTWNKRLARYVKVGQPKKTLELFQQMQREGMNPDKFTFVPVLNACSNLRVLEEGRLIHMEVVRSGHESDLFVGNALVDMYAKCGSIEDARRVFSKMPMHDAVSWNAMIFGYAKCGQGQVGLELSRQMQWERVNPDALTFVAMLNACADAVALEEGRHVHEKIIQRGCESDLFVANSLVDMYASCGSIEDAWKVFNKMPIRDVIAWNAVILGHVKCGQGQKALELAQQMQREGINPDPVSFVGVLNACASISALEEGRRVHEQIIEMGCDSDVFVGSCLVDMYSKCGSIKDACRVFNMMPTRNVVSWTTMLGGYALHGLAKEAIGHFHRMCQEGVLMDGITFLSLLSACSHGGLVDEGLYYFESMTLVNNITPTLEHYACLVDLLGRGGRLHEAEDVIKMMPWKANAALWKSLVSACRVHGNMEVGERVSKHVLELDPANSAGYVLLSNIYAAARKWDSSAHTRDLRLMMKDVTKEVGSTWIEVNSEVHSFTVDDPKHPQIKEIHAELERLWRQMKGAGYLLDTRFADEEEKDLVHITT